jgi:hypothetical protein
MAVNDRTQRGRPRRRQPKPGERVSLGLRVTPDLKSTLDRAAKISGRSQSQEAEFRIERSFANQRLLTEALELAYGREVAAALLILGEIMRSAGRSAGFHATKTIEGADNWFENPYAFEQVSRAAAAWFAGIKPPGDYVLPQWRVVGKVGNESFPSPDELNEIHGEATANGLLDQISRGEHPGILRDDPALKDAVAVLAKRIKSPFGRGK